MSYIIPCNYLWSSFCWERLLLSTTDSSNSISIYCATRNSYLLGWKGFIFFEYLWMYNYNLVLLCVGPSIFKKYKRVSITPFNGPHIIDQINVFDCWHVIKTFRLTDGRWRNAHVWRKLIIGTWLLKAISTFVKCN